MKAYIHLNEILTLREAHHKDGRKLYPSDATIVKDGAVVFDDNKILWVGQTNKIPAEFEAAQKIDLKGHTLTPELVDCHTHVVFAGDRAQEYTDRLNGTSYEEIAQRGGGILYTVEQTQKASADELYEIAVKKVESMSEYGIGTLEIKSGYGLSFEKELELSQIIDRLKKKFAPKIQIINTYLAAHDVPKSFPTSSAYVKQVVIPLLEKLAPMKIIDAVDIFHEKNYFTADDVRALFSKARELKIFCKIHADELNTNGGAELAAEFAALSADHLLKISDAGVQKISGSSTVATLLPGTAFFLGKPLAPARKLLDSGAKVAIGSDYNPGSCHCDNVLMVASISAAQLKLNQTELWCAITHNAAHALGLKDQGAIVVGLKPRFTLFKSESVAHITYRWGKNLATNLP